MKTIFPRSLFFALTEAKSPTSTECPYTLSSHSSSILSPPKQRSFWPGQSLFPTIASTAPLVLFGLQNLGINSQLWVSCKLSATFDLSPSHLSCLVPYMTSFLSLPFKLQLVQKSPCLAAFSTGTMDTGLLAKWILFPVLFCPILPCPTLSYPFLPSPLFSFSILLYSPSYSFTSPFLIPPFLIILYFNNFSKSTYSYF